MNLYWDSWDRHHLRSRDMRSSVPSEDSILYHNNNNNFNDILAQPTSILSLSLTSSTSSPPSTPPSSKQSQGKFLKLSIESPHLYLFFRAAGVKSYTSSPSSTKHEHMSQQDTFSISKSKSHESQLVNRFENGDASSRFVSIVKVIIDWLSDFLITWNCFTSEHQTSTTDRKCPLPIESGSCSIADSAYDGPFPNSYSPTKSPPYSSVESYDNNGKGTSKLNRWKFKIN